MPVLRWGILACGKISGDFVESLHLLPSGEHQVVAAAASQLDRAKEFVQQHDLKNAIAYGSYEALIADPNVEVIYIGLLNHQHFEYTIKSLDAGKNVLCEKPMGLNDREVKAMIAKAREKGLYLQEAFWSRFFPVYKKLKEELKANTIGEVKLVQVNNGVPIMEFERINSIDLGGGVTLDLACYLVMFTLHVFGADAKVEKITASGLLADSGVDKTLTVFIRFNGDRIAQLMCSGEVLLDGHALVGGTLGRLVIPSWVHAPDTLQRDKFTFATGLQSEVFHYPKPQGDPKKFFFHGSAALGYEATAVRQHIQAGLKESPEIPLDESIKIAEILTEIRRQLGVRYPQEKC